MVWCGGVCLVSDLVFCLFLFFRFSPSLYPAEHICRQLVNAFFKKLLKGSLLNWASQHCCLYSCQDMWSWLGLPELSAVWWWSFLSQICWDACICLSWVIPSVSSSHLWNIGGVVMEIDKYFTPSWLEPSEGVSVDILWVTAERDLALDAETDEELNPLLLLLILVTI